MRILLCRRRRAVILVINITLFLSVFMVLWLQTDYSFNQSVPINEPLEAEKQRKVYIYREREKHEESDEPTETSTTAIDDNANINRYSPISSAGKNGEPFYVLPSEMREAKALYHINNFNLMVSDRISVGRLLRDIRSRDCRRKIYDRKSLPDTSVIIVFHNEAWSTLIRTVHSVIKRSHKYLIREIILVDDASERDFLRKPLDDYVAKLPVSVRVIRALNRTGLIRSRLLGAEAAQGKVLTFLDAHCECTKGWLEPLLARIAHNRSIVVCPVIDVIDEDTFAYRTSFYWQIGAFRWDLRFRWYPLTPAERLTRRVYLSKPIRTPAMAGGLFAIDKSYFEEIGKYDDKMEIFGGENIELSFRIWQCGGTLEIIPCSRVGHVFRSVVPYSLPGSEDIYTVYYTNLARAAATWMDEWANFFFKFNPEVTGMMKTTDVRSRLDLRKRLNCKSFGWYLKNVWPGHFFPMPGEFFGKIRNNGSRKCLQVTSPRSSEKQPIGKIKVGECDFVADKTQFFRMSKTGQIMADDSVCLDTPFETEGSYAMTVACFQTSTQIWTYEQETKSISNSYTGLCLDLDYVFSPEDVVMKPCDAGPSQEWILEEIDWASYNANSHS